MVVKNLRFNCHQPGHMVKDCPLMKRAPQPRVFTIKDEPSTSQNVKGKGVLEGTLQFNGIYLRVLFDTGASHSFISAKTIDQFDLKPIISPSPICVSNPIGGKTELKMCCEDITLLYLSHSFRFDFYVLDFKSFNFILGLDWLSKFQAKIKCDREIITLITSLERKARITCGKPGIHTCSFLYALEAP